MTNNTILRALAPEPLNQNPVRKALASRVAHLGRPLGMQRSTSNEGHTDELLDLMPGVGMGPDEYEPFFLNHDDSQGLCPLDEDNLLRLHLTYTNANGHTVYEYSRLEDSFTVADSSTRTTRQYKGVQWHPELRRQADAYGHTIWLASLDKYNEQGDGLWVIERPIHCDDNDNDNDNPPKGGGGKPPTWQQITSTPVFVSGLVKDERESYFIEFSYYQIDANESRWQKALIGFDQLQDEGTGSVWKELARRGLMLSNKKATQKFRQMAADYYAQAQGNPSRYIQTGRARPGWHDINIDGEKVMVYITAGFSTADDIRYTGPQSMYWSRCGDEGAYMRRFAQTIQQNPVVALICGFNAAGLLISHFPQLDHNPLWALLGDSSIGKTLAAETALSMRGKASLFLKNMDATENALKSRMRGFNHTGGAVDEIGSGGEKNIKEKLANIYQWASGNARGRVRANALTGEFDEKMEAERYFYTLLLTGEEAFVDMSIANAGNKVRLAQVVFNKDNPLWHSIRHKDVAEEWRTFITENHGFLYPRLVRTIAAGLERYKTAYDFYSKRLNAAVQSQQQGRKSNAWALAMVGVQLLADELSQVMDIEGNTIDGFTDVDVVFQHAQRLMLLEMDTMPIESESEKFMDFLEGLPAFYKADLFRYDCNLLKFEPLGNPKGVYTFRKGKANGRIVQQHELAIIHTYLDTLCIGKVDKTRFLRWAKETGFLKTYTEKSANGTVERNTCKVTINNTRNVCYKFVWEQRIDIDNDNLNFNV